MYAYELSRAETAEDSADAMKEADEKRLWIEDNDTRNKKKIPDAEKAKESSTKKPPPGTSTISTPSRSSTTTESSSTSTTPWRVRTQRPQMAIVRPQPQVVVVQRSPSPMPKVVDSNRKSRLPLPASPTTSTAEKFSSTKGPRVSLIDQSSFSSGRVRMHDVNGPPLPSKSPTSSSWSNNNNDGYGLRRSATTNISSSSRPGLMSSLSSSNIRRSPHYGLIKVHSSSAINRKPYEITKYHVTIT